MLRRSGRRSGRRQRQGASVILRHLARGKGGDVRFTNRDGSNVGRITPAGVVTKFAISFLAGPLGIAPDGMIFFTEPGVDQIGSIDPFTTTVTEFFTFTCGLPGSISCGSLPNAITAGADGNLWFTEYSADNIARMTPGERGDVGPSRPS
jgi:virginiamycin B lyase